MTYRTFLSCIVVLCASLALTAHAAPRPVKEEINVLFLCFDDQRPDTIAALGNSHIQTPALDSLVKAGTTMTRAYCMGGLQGAVCMPSRAMFNTGKSLFRVDEKLASETTWGEVMAHAGYETFITGKWHNGQPAAARAFQRGKSVFFGGMGDHLKLIVHDKQTDGQWGNKRTLEKFSSEQFADAAIDFLRTRDQTKPFFCYVTFTAPHDPRMPQGKWATMYEGSNRPPLPGDYMPVHPFNNGWMTGRDEALLPWPRTEDAVRTELGLYYGMVTHMDAQIARIVAALDETGVRQNTLIIFTSDHGLAIGSHGLLGKQNLYDHSMHAPLIFAGPRVPAGQQRDAMCYLFDILPTVCDITNVPAPREIDGVSLAPVLAGMQSKTRGSIFTAYMDVQRAVRDERWKLIRYPKINKSQLFDLKADPLELHDLAADPAHADELKRMTALLEQSQQNFGDKQPLSTDHPDSPIFTPPARGARSKPSPE
jgi:arylsulfatase A-like enzyme